MDRAEFQRYIDNALQEADSVFDRLTGGGRRKKNRVKEDAELSAGDTKAMDEFLDGFAIKQNLQQA